MHRSGTLFFNQFLTPDILLRGWKNTLVPMSLFQGVMGGQSRKKASASGQEALQVKGLGEGGEKQWNTAAGLTHPSTPRDLELGQRRTLSLPAPPLTPAEASAWPPF
ncbi:hypothetical protein SKAU_G00078800 [Synaphobranchus kaupii]|uniref:Uncharacterized protein n=1 Tax=Synaphobranchus kaupii TaxID=118154 RepID=A0A9Q1FUK3_SYNKA|nr:hypothetical protein SKAU_G00078800 [Synaphobranchus kaupii]